MRLKTKTPSFAIAIVLLAGCGSSKTSTTPNTALAPAGEKAVAQALKNATPLGEMIQTSGTTRFTVTAYKVSGDELGPWLEVSVRGEAAEQAGTLPYIAIRCASDTDTGGWQASSTVSLGQDIPAGSYLEGTVALLLPDDGRYGEPIPSCTPPALIEVNGDRTQWFAIPDDIIADLNARAAAYNSRLETASTTTG